MNLFRNKRSLISALLSVCALAIAATAIEIRKVNDGINGIIWPYLQPLFLFFGEESNKLELRASPVFPFTDHNIIFSFFVAALITSVLSIVFGISARKNRENSLIYAGAIVLSLFIIVSVLPFFSYIKLE